MVKYLWGRVKKEVGNGLKMIIYNKKLFDKIIII
jgi:hypothetical protein